MNRRRTEHGQGLIEFAVIFPVFILLVFVLIDGGLVMGRYSQVNHAAQEGARYGATGASSGEIAARVRDQSINLLEDVPTGCGGEGICVRWYSGPNGEPRGQVGSLVRVIVRYNYDFVTPLDVPFGVSKFDVDACAMARVERPTSVGGPIPTDEAKCP